MPTNNPTISAQPSVVPSSTPSGSPIVCRDAVIPDLKVTGTAILAIGTVGDRNIRRLRAPIQGIISGDEVMTYLTARENRIAEARILQDGGAQSPFGLDVELTLDIIGPEGGSRSDSGSGSGSSSSDSILLVAVLVLVVLALVCGFGFCFFTQIRLKRHEKEEIVTMHTSPITTYMHNSVSDCADSIALTSVHESSYQSSYTHGQYADIYVD
jgi:hypothetical protein